MWGSVPGPGDHDLSRRQMLNHLSHPGILGEKKKKLQAGKWKSNQQVKFFNCSGSSAVSGLL